MYQDYITDAIYIRTYILESILIQSKYNVSVRELGILKKILNQEERLGTLKELNVRTILNYIHMRTFV